MNAALARFFGHTAPYGILVPQPGIEPVPHAVEAWGFNHWTSREVPAHTLNINGTTSKT